VALMIKGMFAFLKQASGCTPSINSITIQFGRIYHTLEREQRSYRLEFREENKREFEDLVIEIEVGAKICILFLVISYSNFMNPISILVFLFMDS